MSPLWQSLKGQATASLWPVGLSDGVPGRLLKLKTQIEVRHMARHFLGNRALTSLLPSVSMGLQNPPLPLQKKQARQQEPTLRAWGCSQLLNRDDRAVQRAKGQHSLQNFLNASVENALKCLSPAAEWVKRQFFTSEGVLQCFTQPDRAQRVTEPKEKINKGLMGYVIKPMLLWKS